MLQPRTIHLNQDEVVGIGRDGRDILRMRADGRTPGQLFADLLNGFRDTVREAGSRATLLVWDDGLTPLHGGWSRNYNAPHYPFDALDYLSPADFTICVWRYGYGSGPRRPTSSSGGSLSSVAAPSPFLQLPTGASNLRAGPGRIPASPEAFL